MKDFMEEQLCLVMNGVGAVKKNPPVGGNLFGSPDTEDTIGVLDNDDDANDDDWNHKRNAQDYQCTRDTGGVDVRSSDKSRNSTTAFPHITLPVISLSILVILKMTTIFMMTMKT